jgi:hypothetical protein
MNDCCSFNNSRKEDRPSEVKGKLKMNTDFQLFNATR